MARARKHTSTPQPATPTILVAGDVLIDLNLVRQPGRSGGTISPFREAALEERVGGAIYLAELVTRACADVVATVRGPRPTVAWAKASSVWAVHHAGPGPEAGQVWRVEEFLGCQHGTAAKDPQLDGYLAPSVLVLDDLGLGFAASRDAWPAALGSKGDPQRIVFKCRAPLGEGPLWAELLARWADRLTVVLDVAALRMRGAAISRAVSWDLAIEEVVREVQHGPSARDLGRCRRVVVRFTHSGAASFTRVPPCFERPGGKRRTDRLSERARFERFAFHPVELEGGWEAHRPGIVQGSLSVLSAAVVRHELAPGTYPMHLALSRGLAASRRLHDAGAGPPEVFDPRASFTAIGGAYHPPDGQDPGDAFRSAFPHDVLADPELSRQPGTISNLLRDLTGAGLEHMETHAAEVVLQGPERALAAVPSARYGKYFTVDRQEIERINGIRNLLLAYAGNLEDRRPLCLAVFGPPGSGKSFAVKELTSDLFTGARPLKFNLSQMRGAEELESAFHQIRDASLKGQIPVVFWDEFDSDELRWLKAFLAPMQDGEFSAGGFSHPIGRAIFVFAGGTAVNMAEFDRTRATGKVGARFREVKGPDFVSRLRGYVDIKGPDPVDPEDPPHLIRRAIILRGTLERLYPNLIDPKTRRAAVSRSVIAGFLRVGRYLHGARSLESVVSMSDLLHAERFSAAHLPSRDLLALHVSGDFVTLVSEGELELDVIEALAEAYHEAWAAWRRRHGWRFGERRDDAGKLHPRLVPYARLSNAWKEDNRAPARLAHARLRALGYLVQRKPGARPPGARLSRKEVRELEVAEHDRWLREKLLQGFTWGAETRESLRQHPDVAPFSHVPPEDRELDRVQIEAIVPTLERHGYKLIRRRGRGG